MPLPVGLRGRNRRIGDRAPPLDVLIGKIHFTPQPRIDYFRFVFRLSLRQPRLSVSSIYPINFYTQYSRFDDIASNFRRLNRPTEFIFVSTLLRVRLSVISVGSNHYTFRALLPPAVGYRCTKLILR